MRMPPALAESISAADIAPFKPFCRSAGAVVLPRRVGVFCAWNHVLGLAILFYAQVSRKIRFKPAQNAPIRFGLVPISRRAKIFAFNMFPQICYLLDYLLYFLE